MSTTSNNNFERRLVGYATFIVYEGNIAYDDLDLMSRENAIEHALDLIQCRYEDDPFANPNHPEHVVMKKRFPKAEPTDYDEMRDAARRLHRVDLDDDESLFIMEVYAYRRKQRPFRRLFRFLAGLFKR